MFSNGVYWYLVFSFLPNENTMLSIVFCIAVIIVTTFAGYLLFFRKRTNAQIDEMKYVKLLIRNLLSSISSQYLAIIICILLGALAGRAGIEAIGSLEKLSGYDLLINQIAGIFIIVYP